MKNNKFRMILYVICILMFISSVTYLVYYQYSKSNEKKLLEEIQLEKQKSEVIAEAGSIQSEKKHKLEETKTVNEEQCLPEYKQLYEENNDLYGWIKIKDTVVNYPVMYTPDEPNYYIHKNWEKKEASNGSIYIDGRCTKDSENLIVYGHNMKDRSMFGSLREYKQKEYYENHKYIEFDTIYEKQMYQIIAVAKAVIYYKEQPPADEYLFYEHVELDSKEEFEVYVKNVKQNSYYNIETTAEYGDALITLCTCDYWTDNARLLIVAKKI